MSEERIDYNEEPVVFCKKCYSLNIQHEDAIDADCCMDCGCTETASTSIYTWEMLYERRYGHKLVEVNHDPRNSDYFKMSLRELKGELYKRGDAWNIIRELYPHFPKSLSLQEAVIVLFDKLVKDGKLDKLKYALYEHSK